MVGTDCSPSAAARIMLFFIISALAYKPQPVAGVCVCVCVFNVEITHPQYVASSLRVECVFGCFNVESN